MTATDRHEWTRWARSHLRRRAPRRHTIRQGTVAGRSWQPVNNDRDYNKLLSQIGFKTRLCEESGGVVVSMTEGIVMKNVGAPCQDKWMYSTCEGRTMNVQQDPKRIVKRYYARYMDLWLCARCNPRSPDTNIDDRLLCQACCNNEKRVHFPPCEHVYYCVDCWITSEQHRMRRALEPEETPRECPVCRAKIIKVSKILLTC